MHRFPCASAAPAGSRQQASVMLYVMGGLRLFLEWMMVPMFAIALQVGGAGSIGWQSAGCDGQSGGF